MSHLRKRRENKGKRRKTLYFFAHFSGERFKITMKGDKKK